MNQGTQLAGDSTQPTPWGQTESDTLEVERVEQWVCESKVRWVIVPELHIRPAVERAGTRWDQTRYQWSTGVRHQCLQKNKLTLKQNSKTFLRFSLRFWLVENSSLFVFYWWRTCLPSLHQFRVIRNPSVTFPQRNRLKQPDLDRFTVGLSAEVIISAQSPLPIAERVESQRGCQCSSESTPYPPTPHISCGVGIAECVRPPPLDVILRQSDCGVLGSVRQWEGSAGEGRCLSWVWRVPPSTTSIIVGVGQGVTWTQREDVGEVLVNWAWSVTPSLQPTLHIQRGIVTVVGTGAGTQWEPGSVGAEQASWFPSTGHRLWGFLTIKLLLTTLPNRCVGAERGVWLSFIFVLLGPFPVAWICGSRDAISFGRSHPSFPAMWSCKPRTSQV
jgi:hypothetical protein